MDDRLKDALYALADMFWQFGYETTYRNQKCLYHGGLSALENAYGILVQNGCKTKGGVIAQKDLAAFIREVYTNA